MRLQRRTARRNEAIGMFGGDWSISLPWGGGDINPTLLR